MPKNRRLLFYHQIRNTEQERVAREAKKILNHHFEVLSQRIKFGKKINWQTNFAGQSWPKEPYEEFRAKNYDFDSKRYIGDIKLPWELNKHLYLQDLAKAYLVTKNEKYAQEFVEQIEDWLKENPFMVGVNWIEGLIASHRAISWIIALSGFRGSKIISSSFLKKFKKSLYQHALFIEKTYEFCQRASNHLLGELCAQIILSVSFPDFAGSQKRLAEAIKYLIKELDLQVYADGVDYEQSLSYQRVILEFLYLPLILEKRKLVKLPRAIIKITEKMTEFMMHMTQPNGLLQPISDADGARVFVLGNDINDFRPHLALAAWLFDRPDFKYVSENKIEPVAWFLLPAEIEAFNQLESKPPQKTSIAFPQGGYWISRQNWSRDASWLFFDCGYMGMGKWSQEIPVGVHGHSDTLNFGLSLGTETFITDNGSYSYTTERPFHLYFRSSVAHNVAIVDGEDQNVIDKRPWLAYQHALPQNSSHIFTNEMDYFTGEHTGFLRLPSRVLHKREIMHFKKKNLLILKDTFFGEGRHKITGVFHLMPNLKVKSDKAGFEIIGIEKHLNIQPLFEAHKTIVKGKSRPVEGWYSLTYGQKIAAPVLKFEFEAECPSSRYFLLSWDKNILSEEPIELFNKSFEEIKKPRILMMVTNDLAADPRVQKEALSVSQAGYDVSVLAFSPPSSERTFRSDDYKVYHFAYQPFSPLMNFRHRLGNLIMRIYFKNKYFSAILTPFSVLKKYLRTKTLSMIDNDINQPTGQKDPPAAVVSTEPKQMGFLKKVITAIHYFYNLNNKLIEAGIKTEPDIIHAHDLDTLLAGYLIKRKTHAKLIYDSHELWTKQGMPIPQFLISLMGFLEKYLLTKIDALVSVNESIIRRLEQMYQKTLKIPKIAIYNASKFIATKIERKFTKEISVLYQGRFAPNRGLENLVLASQFFAPNLKLYFRCTGEKDVEAKIGMLVKNQHLEKKVQFLKPVGMYELTKSAKFAQIGVIPYLPVNENNRLATPNKLFEYVMSGLAIAGSDLPEIAKFVKKYKNGLLFNPYRPKNIARVINQMAANPTKLQAMRKNSLKAAKTYNWQNQATKLLSLYSRILRE